MRKTPVEQAFYQRLLPARAVADRYGTHLRTVSRWVARGVIPPPSQIINSRRYWSVEVLEQADRRRTIEAGAKGQPANPSTAP
jgi:DNA-binding transcriptional MerR regulator